MIAFRKSLNSIKQKTKKNIRKQEWIESFERGLITIGFDTRKKNRYDTVHFV